MQTKLVERSVAFYNSFFGVFKEAAPKWRGFPCQQFPSDLFRYARLIWELNPPFVIEVGTAQGGTALFLSDVMASFGVGKVVTVDIHGPDTELPNLRNLTTIRGNSIDSTVLKQIREMAGQQRGLVLLDGNHASGHVLDELEEYSDLADYLVVEDTIMQWLDRGWDDNPYLAVSYWLPKHPEFALDDMALDVTQHPGGWLKRLVTD